MGQALGSMIKSIDGGDDAQKEVRDALNALFALGESRNDAAWAKATSDSMKVYAPIQKVLLQRQQIVAKASTGTNEIVNGIKNSVGNLMKGQILDGVTDIIQNCLNVVLGTAAGQISSNYTYALVATDLGALLRLDVDVYSFECTSQGLINKAQNMTAVTAIVSSINPMALTVGDLRAIVSLSYGNSPEERQKQIFDLVKSAWENDRKLAVGQSLTSLDVEAHNQLVVPSQYEAKWLADTGGVSAPLSLDTPGGDDKDKDANIVVDRQTLRAALVEHRDNARSVAATGGGALMGLDTPGPANGTINPASQWADVDIFMELNAKIDEDWFNMMGGALSGFNVDSVFRYVGPTRGKSGSAITFGCQVHSDPKLFDLGIAYMQETVLPRLRQAQYLISVVSHMALQYQHPSVKGDGEPTKVQYIGNTITNNTQSNIRFLADHDGAVLLEVAAGQSGVLDGAVMVIESITGAAPAPPKPAEGGTTGETPGGTPAPPAPPAPPAKDPAGQSRRWVTYEEVLEDRLIAKTPMALTELPAKGFALTVWWKHSRESTYTVNYDTEWVINN